MKLRHFAADEARRELALRIAAEQGAEHAVAAARQALAAEMAFATHHPGDDAAFAHASWRPAGLAAQQEAQARLAQAEAATQAARAALAQARAGARAVEQLADLARARRRDEAARAAQLRMEDLCRKP